MLHFICYDIESDQWRGKLAKLLGKRGCKRVQRSVFVAVDFSPKELGQLRQALIRQVLPHLQPRDSVLCLPVESDLTADMIWHGDNHPLEAAKQLPLTKLL